MLEAVPLRPALGGGCCMGPLCPRAECASNGQEAVRTRRRQVPGARRGCIKPPFLLPDKLAASISLSRPEATGKARAQKKNREAFRPPGLNLQPPGPLEGEPE